MPILLSFLFSLFRFFFFLWQRGYVFFSRTNNTLFKVFVLMLCWQYIVCCDYVSYMYTNILDFDILVLCIVERETARQRAMAANANDKSVCICVCSLMCACRCEDTVHLIVCAACIVYVMLYGCMWINGSACCQTKCQL